MMFIGWNWILFCRDILSFVDHHFILLNIFSSIRHAWWTHFVIWWTLIRFDDNIFYWWILLPKTYHIAKYLNMNLNIKRSIVTITGPTRAVDYNWIDKSHIIFFQKQSKRCHIKFWKKKNKVLLTWKYCVNSLPSLLDNFLKFPKIRLLHKMSALKTRKSISVSKIECSKVFCKYDFYI